MAHTSVEALDHDTKIFLDLTAGGQALEKNYDKVYTLLNQMAQGNIS